MANTNRASLIKTKCTGKRRTINKDQEKQSNIRNVQKIVHEQWLEQGELSDAQLLAGKPRSSGMIAMHDRCAAEVYIEVQYTLRAASTASRLAVSGVHLSNCSMCCCELRFTARGKWPRQTTIQRKTVFHISPEEEHPFILGISNPHYFETSDKRTSTIIYIKKHNNNVKEVWHVSWICL